MKLNSDLMLNLDVRKRKQFALGMRRLEHLPYFSSSIRKLTQEGYTVALFIDSKYVKKITDTQIEASFLSAGISVSSVHRMESLEHPYLKNKVSVYSYLANPAYDIDYLTRHMQRARFNPIDRFIVRALGLIPKRKFFIDKLLNKCRRKFSKHFTYNPEIQGIIKQCDFLIVTPGNMIDSVEDDLFLYAEQCAINSFWMVLSWDNLNSKGTPIKLPTKALVWNRLHAQLAVDQHGIEAKNVQVIGSSYHELYASNGSISKQIDLKDVFGIPVEKNVVVYLGSSANIHPNESIHLSELLSDGSWLERHFLIIRPHPAHTMIWSDWNLPGTYVWPKNQNLLQRDIAETSTLFDQTYLAVGINTSSLWDALALDCPVACIQVPGTIFSDNTSHLNFAKEFGLLTFRNFMEIEENFDKVKESLQALKPAMLPNFGQTGNKFLQAINETQGR
jgi:hypothetical protein